MANLKTARMVAKSLVVTTGHGYAIYRMGRAKKKYGVRGVDAPGNDKLEIVERIYPKIRPAKPTRIEIVDLNE